MNPGALTVNSTAPELTILIKALRYDIEENGGTKKKQELLSTLIEALNLKSHKN